MSSRSVTPHSTSNPDPGFDIHKVLDKGLELAAHSWEWGTAAEALLELYSPELSVFCKDPFPGDEIPKVDVEKVPSLVYARKFISTEGGGLCEGDGEWRSYAWFWRALVVCSFALNVFCSTVKTWCRIILFIILHIVRSLSCLFCSPFRTAYSLDICFHQCS